MRIQNKLKRVLHCIVLLSVFAMAGCSRGIKCPTCNAELYNKKNAVIHSRKHKQKTKVLPTTEQRVGSLERDVEAIEKDMIAVKRDLVEIKESGERQDAKLDEIERLLRGYVQTLAR